MVAGTDGEEAFEEGCGRAPELAVHAVYKGTGAKSGSVQKYFNSGVKRERIVLERDKLPKIGGKKGRKGQEKGGTGDIRGGNTELIAAKLHQGDLAMFYLGQVLLRPGST